MAPPRAGPGGPGADREGLAGRVQAIETQIQALAGQMQQLSDQVARMRSALGNSGATPQSGEAGEGRRGFVQQGRAPQPRMPRGEQDRSRQQAGQQQFGTTTVRPEQQSRGEQQTRGEQQEGRLPYGSGRQQERQSAAMPWQQSPASPSQQQGTAAQQQGGPSQRQGAPSQQQSRDVARADPQARAAYESAYNRLLQRDFKAAASGFRDFLANHPDDPLAGNAQYWLGETYYVRGQYREAAESFLNGYREYRDSDKAPATLLKLGMSLYQMGQQEEACSAFSELENNFPGAPASLKQRAASESERAGC
jgi:tol-pal system protein YbgF